MTTKLNHKTLQEISQEQFSALLDGATAPRSPRNRTRNRTRGVKTDGPGPGASLDNITNIVSACAGSDDLDNLRRREAQLKEIEADIKAQRQAKSAKYQQKKQTEKNVTNQDNQAEASRDFLLYKFRQVSRKILNDTRHKHCGCRVISRKSEPEIWATKGDRVAYKHLMACGSSWVCPVCRFKLMNYRQAELMITLKYAENQGYNMGHLVLTVDHTRETDTIDLVKRMGEAFRVALGHRRLRKYQFGMIKNMEYTHGVNGWHPHYHIILMSLESPAKLKRIARTIKLLWLDKFPGATEINQKYEPVWNSVTEDKNIGEYITKSDLTWEVAAKTGKKNARAGLNPVQIPAMIHYNQLGKYTLDQLEAIYRDFYRVSKGQNTLNYNKVARELRAEALGLFGISEKSDDEVLHDESELIFQVLKIQGNLFRDIVKKGCEVELLQEVHQMLTKNLGYSHLVKKFEDRTGQLLEMEGIKLKYCELIKESKNERDEETGVRDLQRFDGYYRTIPDLVPAGVDPYSEAGRYKESYPEIY